MNLHNFQQQQNNFKLQQMLGQQIPQQLILGQQFPMQQQFQQVNNVRQNQTEESSPSPTKRKNNRDPRNRIWICGCGRSYGSNAALYTHIKNKHNGFQPKNTIKPPQSDQAGRRGRPLQNIKKYGQFKKGEDFVEIDNIEERRNKIIHDKDSNQLLVAFLEFGDTETSLNPFEGIVTDKKGQEFLVSGLTMEHIIKVEKDFRKAFNIEKDKSLQDNTYKILQRFAQVWQQDPHAEEFVRLIIFSQFYEGQNTQKIINHINQFKDNRIDQQNQNNKNQQQQQQENQQDENQQQEENQKEESQNEKKEEKVKQNENKQEQEIQKIQKNDDKDNNNNIINQFPYILYCKSQLDDFESRLEELNKKIFDILNPSDEESDINLSDSEDRTNNGHKLCYNKQSDSNAQNEDKMPNDSILENKQNVISLNKIEMEENNQNQEEIGSDENEEIQNEDVSENNDNDSIQEFLNQHKKRKQMEQEQQNQQQQQKKQINQDNQNQVDDESEQQQQNSQQKQQEQDLNLNKNQEKIINNDTDIEQTTAPVKKKSQQYGSEDESTSQQNQLINTTNAISVSSNNNSSNKNSCKNSTDITQVIPSQKVE